MKEKEESLAAPFPPNPDHGGRKLKLRVSGQPKVLGRLTQTFQVPLVTMGYNH